VHPRNADHIVTTTAAFFRSRFTIATLAPSAAKRRANAAPIPCDPPVTMATRSLSLIPTTPLARHRSVRRPPPGRCGSRSENAVRRENVSQVVRIDKLEPRLSRVRSVRDIKQGIVFRSLPGNLSSIPVEPQSSGVWACTADAIAPVADFYVEQILQSRLNKQRCCEKYQRAMR
jgi:hypothetical protein